MKTAKKLLGVLLLIGLPLILSADEKEVTKYRWYKTIETNVSYKKNATNECSNYDLDNYIETDWIYTLDKPEEAPYRTIETTTVPLNLSRKHAHILKLKDFKKTEGYASPKVSEVEKTLILQ